VAEEKTYLFGPVPSRRLGLSLGVDIVPLKTCTLDCIYCQLAETTEKTVQRKEYVPVEPVLNQLKDRLTKGLQADYITFSGSGEPTLNSSLGQFIDLIKKITNIPIAILTNGTLLYLPDVRADCAKADVVLPSLDAADEQTFHKINRPHPDISFKNLISGLCAFRNEFVGRIWLEVFLLEGINTSPEQIEKIADAVKRICPDRIQLNTAVRPTADPMAQKVETEKLQEIAKLLGPNCEVVDDFSPLCHRKNLQTKAKYVLSILKRRPCSLEDICAGLGIQPDEALKYINHFQHQGIIVSEQKEGRLFFSAR
jgi:wyosine [tRNA(Phe)-imidazoG37] synthetase (radical SAM superfamily)